MNQPNNYTKYQNNPGQLEADNLRGKQMEQQNPHANQSDKQHQGEGEDEGLKRPNQDPKPATQQ